MKRKEDYKTALESIARSASDNIDRAVTNGDLDNTHEPLQIVEDSVNSTYKNYRTKLHELREFSHQLLREQLKDENFCGSSHYNPNPWNFETTLGRSNDEVNVEMRYSGVQQKRRGVFGFIKDKFVKEKPAQVSLQAILRYGGKEEAIFPLLFDSRIFTPSNDNIPRSIADYLHQLIKHTISVLNSHQGKNSSNLDFYGWFEDTLVCKTSRLLGCHKLIPFYLECTVRYNIEDTLSKLENQFLSDAEKNKTAFEKVLEDARKEIKSVQESFFKRLNSADGDLTKHINEKKKQIQSIMENAIRQLGEYRDKAYATLESDVLKEVKERRSNLEKELTILQKEKKELERNLARKEGNIPESRVYFVDELTKVFLDYDTWPDERDIRPENRAEYARILADRLVKDGSVLDNEEIMEIIYALSESVKKSGGKKFDAKDMHKIIDQTLWIASRIGKPNLNMVVNKIRELGTKRKTTPDKIQKVLQSLI